MNVSTRLRRVWIPLVASCLLATGCGSIGRLGYENLPTLATWRADSYLSLNSEQRALASQRIEALHGWHRRTQLDDYIAFLKDVQRRVEAGDVDEAQIKAWRVAALERIKPIADRAAPSVAEVAVTLAPAQLDKLRAEMSRDNDKMRRERLPAERGERVEARAKRYIERAETFLGPLTAEQRQFARRFAADAPDSEAQWFAQRVARQQDLLATMDRIRTERPSDAVASRWMHQHLMRYTQQPDDASRASTESSLAAGDAMSAAMLERATPKQRAHLQRKLQEWIDLLVSLKPAQGQAASSAAIAVN